MPELPPNDLEPLLDCLEQWDMPEQPGQLEAWLRSRPDARTIFAEQRAIHLALQARAGNEPSHHVLRTAIVAAVQDEAAPPAIKRSILAAVSAEARAQSPFERARRFLAAHRWIFGTAAAIAIGSCAFLMITPQSSPVPDLLFANVESVSGSVEIQSRRGPVPAVAQMFFQTGDEIRVGSNAALSLVLSNRIRVQLGPESALKIASQNALVLVRGLLKATILTQDVFQVSVETPHLKIDSQQGELAIQTSPLASHLEVTAGKARVKSTHSPVTIEALGGQMVRSEGNLSEKLSAVTARRNVWEWPFSIDSPWNTSIGSQALYAPVSAPRWPPGNITNCVLVRPIFVAGGTNARVQLVSPGEAPRRIRYPEWWQPEPKLGEIVCALFPDDNLCCEMTEPIRLPSMDVQVRERHSTDVLGHGVGWSWPRPRIIAGSALAGLVRRGELTFGVRHALALAVHPDYINADNGYDGHRWPGVPIAPELIEQLGHEGNLALGSLLAIPAWIDVTSLGLGSSGPGFEIARALQDYGAYVIQTSGANVQLIASADAGLPSDIDRIINIILPHLRLVANNHSRNLAGGGERRRPPAPALLQAGAPSQ
jgi:hypothetical protein